MTNDKYVKALLKIAKSATASAKKMPTAPSAYKWRLPPPVGTNKKGVGFLLRGVQFAHDGADPLEVLNLLIEAYRTSVDSSGISGELPPEFLATPAGRIWERDVHPKIVDALLLMDEHEFATGT